MSGKKITIAVFTPILVGTALCAAHAANPQKSIQDQLVGSWTLVSMSDGAGSKGDRNVARLPVKVTATFALDGHVKWTVTGPAPAKGSPALRSGNINYFLSSTYSVNEADRTVSYKNEPGSLPLSVGNESKSKITIGGAQFEQVSQAPQFGQVNVVRTKWQRLGDGSK